MKILKNTDIENKIIINDDCSGYRKKIKWNNKYIQCGDWDNKEELIEYGSFIGGSWLTEKGKEFLNDMEISLRLRRDNK